VQDLVFDYESMKCLGVHIALVNSSKSFVQVGYLSGGQRLKGEC
jgi:hypothetical protein